MKKQVTLFAVLAIAGTALLGSCVRGEWTDGPKEPQKVSFSAGISGAAHTSRTATGGDAWAPNDEVGIYMLSVGGAIPAGILEDAANIPYEVTNTSSGALAPVADPIYFPPTGNVAFIAYYPYSTTVTDGIYSVNLTDQTAPEDIDVLRDTVLNHPNATPVTLAFTHVLSKITINIKGGTPKDIIDVQAMEDGDVSLSNTPVSVNINLNTGTVTNVSDGPIDLLEDVPTLTFHATFRAILSPHVGEAGRELSVEVGDHTYKWNLPAADLFEFGKHYTYEATIENQTITVSATTITPWIPETGGALVSVP